MTPLLRGIRIVLLNVIGFGLAADASALTLTYQDGDGGAYSDTQGTMIFANLPSNNHGSDADIGLAGSFIGSGLVSFDDIIGPNSGQVGLGSAIVEAILTVTVGNSSALTFTAHQLLVDWDENTLTWNTLGGSPGPDGGIDYVTAAADSFVPSGTAPFTFDIDVTSIVQAWADGDANYGILLLGAGVDAFTFRSDDNATQSDRPILSVTVVPEPATALLVALGMAGLSLARGTRAAKS
jgi:hypothetical protein